MHKNDFYIMLICHSYSLYLNFNLCIWDDYQSIQMNKVISEFYQYLKWRKTLSGKNICFANGIAIIEHKSPE